MNRACGQPLGPWGCYGVMAMADGYERRVSAEEAREGYLLIEKSKLPLFPARGQPFVLVRGREELQASLDAYACSCRGPDRPHEHFVVRVSGLKRGQQVRLRRTRDDRYELDVRS